MTRKPRAKERPSASITSFSCIDRERRYDGLAAATDMVNFRRRKDGALEKRCGYEKVLSVPSLPRAVYTGYYGGESVLYLLTESSIFRREPDDEFGIVYAGKVKKSEGDAAFVELMGGLWLFDGDDVYLLSKDGIFESVEGYIPLFGKNWDPASQGEIYEAENYLTSRVRIHYQNPKAQGTLYFGRRVVSIHGLWLDGVEAAKTEVELHETCCACEAEIFRTAKEIELLVTLDEEDTRQTITSARRAVAYGGAEDNRLLLWDGEDKNAFYVSRAVTHREARRSDTLGKTKGGALYFPRSAEEYRLDAPITATSRYFDRLLIFTASGTWAAEFKGGELLVTSVHTSVGCDKKDCAVLAGEDPVSLCGGQLWRWNARPTVQRECTAELLSSPVSDLTRAFSEGKAMMQYYPELSELWVTECGNENGRVLVYNAEAGGFYTYEGIHLDRLVPSSEMPVFTRDTSIFSFSEACLSDPSDAEIRAYYRSGWIDFGSPAQQKRLVGLTLLGDPDGERITVRVESERGHAAAIDLYGEGNETPNLYERRVGIGRFRYLRFLFEAVGEAKPCVSGLTLSLR